MYVCMYIQYWWKLKCTLVCFKKVFVQERLKSNSVINIQLGFNYTGQKNIVPLVFRFLAYQLVMPIDGVCIGEFDRSFWEVTDGTSICFGNSQLCKINILVCDHIIRDFIYYTNVVLFAKYIKLKIVNKSYLIAKKKKRYFTVTHSLYNAGITCSFFFSFYELSLIDNDERVLFVPLIISFCSIKLGNTK